MDAKRLILSLVSTLLMFGGVQAQVMTDHGDAPDPSFPTLNLSNGASHLVGPLILGYRVDPEVDGLPTVNASGDDFSSMYDDEDGVLFLKWLIPGQNDTIQVITSGGGVLNAWIDWNKNGSWADPGDQIFTTQTLGAGLNTLAYPVPATAVPGIHTYARFRFSTLPTLGPGGPAPDGEVEDYMVYIGTPPPGVTIMDPDPGTSSTQNEISMVYQRASHTLVAAYNDDPFPGGSGIGVSTSPNKGQTWTSQQLAMPMSAYSGVNLLDAFDPTAACDDSGSVFVAHIATDYNWGSGPESGLYLHKSPDGGMTWLPPVTVDHDSNASTSPDPGYRFNDRCQMAVDLTQGSPYHNYIYLAWIKDRGWNMAQPYSDI